MVCYTLPTYMITTFNKRSPNFNFPSLNAGPSLEMFLMYIGWEAIVAVLTSRVVTPNPNP